MKTKIAKIFSVSSVLMLVLSVVAMVWFIRIGSTNEKESMLSYHGDVIIGDKVYLAFYNQQTGLFDFYESADLVDINRKAFSYESLSIDGSSKIPRTERLKDNCLSPKTQISLPYLSDGTYLTDEMLEELNLNLERERLGEMINKKGLGFMQIGMLVLGVVSFAYLIGGMWMVNATEYTIQEANFLDLLSDDLYRQAVSQGINRISIGSDKKIIALYSLGDDGNPNKVFSLVEGNLVQDTSYLKDILGGKTQEVKSPGTCLSSSISLADLSTKPISSIKPGEEVLSYDFETGKLTKEIVRDVIVSWKSEYLIVNKILEITPNHEVLLNGKWQPIGNAVVGDYLQGINSEKVFIESIEKVVLDEPIDVYDLDLGGKWFFAEGVLVHNSGPSGAPTAVSSVGGREVEPTLPPGDHPPRRIPGLGWNITQNQSFFWPVYHLAEGLLWGKVVSEFAGFVAQMAGTDEGQVETIKKAIFFGVTSFNTMRGIMTAKWFGSANEEKSLAQLAAKNKFFSFGEKLGAGFYEKFVPIAIGVGVAWYHYVKNYEKTEKFEERVEFKCLPWQAPHGGEDCELCNHDQLPCSEYRCKSLGQTCAFISQGEKGGICVDNSTREVSPPVITPWKEVLTEGYTYTDVRTSPPGPGFKIIRTEGLNACIKAFSPIQFGVTTNEPAQCKIDLEKKNSFEEMLSFMGGDNTYRKNFTEILHVPRAKDLKNSSLTLEMGKEMTLYLMCRDAKGNLNTVPYSVRFCVDDEPDNTPPQIKAVSVESGSCVTADQNHSLVEFYTDEPAECKWDFNDRTFEQMTYNMSCTQHVFEINSLLLYTCRANLTGVKRDGTDYYIKCKDNPGMPEKERNTMANSFNYKVRGSNHLKIKSISPNNITIYGGISPMPVNLTVETLFGCDNNKATCFYSFTGEQKSFVPFFDTNKADGVSKQRLDLFSGVHKYYIKCIDGGGNLAEAEAQFELEIDTFSPVIARAYHEDDYLKIVTFRRSDCVYSTESCDYLFEEGTLMPYSNSPVHVTAWDNEKTYYIKCRDEFRNEPIGCSLIVRPRKNFLF